MSHRFKSMIYFMFCLSMTVLTSMVTITPTTVFAASSEDDIILLNCYSKTMAIGDEYYLSAFSLLGKKISFSSSRSKIASVNRYGKITAKKSGTAKITAKSKCGEASCSIRVAKTTIQLSSTSVSLENGYTTKLTAKVSTHHVVTWRSSKKSIATIDDHGIITARKPGKTTITAKVDGVSATCQVTVKKPTVQLSKSTLTLYRTQVQRINCKCSSKSTPVWKSNKTSVAIVDDNGNITAIKHGTAIITATVDGVSKTCRVTVKSPTITFHPEKLELSVGQTYKPTVTVSSGITPEYSSSNVNVASVDSDGTIHARQAGKAYIYAKEDGQKSSLILTVK